MKTFKRIINDILIGTLGPMGERGSRWLLFLPVFGICVLLVVLTRQTVMGLPIATRPLPGEMVHGQHLMLAWNAVPGARVHVQLGADRSFKTFIYEHEYEKITHTRLRDKFDAPGVYYWRMRIIRNGRAGSWIRPIKFFVE